MPAHAEAKPDEEKKKLPHAPRDSAREVIETIVFVVVLVLLLKLFVTEAFVIPTGSMAETLYGYQKMITCPKCGHEFPVNSHDEVEGRDGRRMNVFGYCCPNCRYKGRVQELSPVPQNNTGDRVLVLKPLYHIRNPERGDVVVFKFPEKPQEKFTAQNYIKRAMGFGGETIGIYRGDLFVTRALEYPPDALDEYGEPLFPRPRSSDDLWKPRYMYPNVSIPGKDQDDGAPGRNPVANERFARSREAGFPSGTGGFEIIRKEEDQLLASLRIVWDNDQQPAELSGKVAPRWYPALGDADPNGQPPPVFWNGDNAFQPKVFAHDSPDLHWLRYRHLVMPWRSNPTGAAESGVAADLSSLSGQSPVPIDNFLGYNAGMNQDPESPNDIVPRDNTGTDRYWVGDLCIECQATLALGGEVILELSRGVNRFRATFRDGKAELSRIGAGSEEFGKPTRDVKVTSGTAHTLRFANIDCRLWVWVDGRRIDFGTDGDYRPPTPEEEAAFRDAGGNPDMHSEGWTRTNDVDAPASIGAKGNVRVQSIKLFRDIFYTRRGINPDPTQAGIYYVQPGHFLCLGDNSAHSSDSRDWGTVPERLMLGKAVFVFWPAWPNNRVGLIK